MAHSKTVAWGEIGLDYHPFPGHDYAEPSLQRKIFQQQIRLSLEYQKPIIIHTREAEEDTLQMMTEHIPVSWPLHVHCFTDSLEFAQKLMDTFPNLWFGFTGVITFKNSSELQRIVKEIPLNRILLETDGPFMAPIPYRGKVCHPGHVMNIAEKIAEIKQKSLDEICQVSRYNTKLMYGI
eukprot:TRINITY_DN1848_c0_g1_i1.p1 TRINITY_DN1848_c0_g1~~TRINITY_DN1848_c0_g1_i1.p1  ORF type:complete len:180 (+),score=26.88 TRINITY_DN1848_c0_g1_i1:320-859(+)